LIAAQKDRLLNLRIAGEIDEETFSQKQTELRDRYSAIKLQLDVLDRSQDENADLTSKVFELSQTLRERWLTADYAEKRKILDIVWLNCRLDDTTLCPQIRKPFDALAEGLVSEKGGGLNEIGRAVRKPPVWCPRRKSNRRLG
jgi:site-specific DNA recombinase